jgi:hypothetical protein
MTVNRNAEAPVSNTVGPREDGAARAQRLHYVFQMLRELREMAVAEKAETLAWLLDMAIMEAGELAEAAKEEAA